jgi:hypothetical protein
MWIFSGVDFIRIQDQIRYDPVSYVEQKYTFVLLFAGLWLSTFYGPHPPFHWSHHHEGSR